MPTDLEVSGSSTEEGGRRWVKGRGRKALRPWGEVGREQWGQGLANLGRGRLSSAACPEGTAAPHVPHLQRDGLRWREGWGGPAQGSSEGSPFSYSNSGIL